MRGGAGGGERAGGGFFIVLLDLRLGRGEEGRVEKGLLDILFGRDS